VLDRNRTLGFIKIGNEKTNLVTQSQTQLRFADWGPTCAITCHILYQHKEGQRKTERQRERENRKLVEGGG